MEEPRLSDLFLHLSAHLTSFLEQGLAVWQNNQPPQRVIFVHLLASIQQSISPNPPKPMPLDTSETIQKKTHPHTLPPQLFVVAQKTVQLLVDIITTYQNNWESSDTQSKNNIVRCLLSITKGSFPIAAEIIPSIEDPFDLSNFYNNPQDIDSEINEEPQLRKANSVNLENKDPLDKNPRSNSSPDLTKKLNRQSTTILSNLYSTVDTPRRKKILIAEELEPAKNQYLLDFQELDRKSVSRKAPPKRLNLLEELEPSKNQYLADFEELDRKTKSGRTTTNRAKISLVEELEPSNNPYVAEFKELDRQAKKLQPKREMAPLPPIPLRKISFSKEEPELDRKSPNRGNRAKVVVLGSVRNRTSGKRPKPKVNQTDAFLTELEKLFEGESDPPDTMDPDQIEDIPTEIGTLLSEATFQPLPDPPSCTVEDTDQMMGTFDWDGPGEKAIDDSEFIIPDEWLDSLFVEERIEPVVDPVVLSVNKKISITDSLLQSNNPYLEEMAELDRKTKPGSNTVSRPQSPAPRLDDEERIPRHTLKRNHSPGSRRQIITSDEARESSSPPNQPTTKRRITITNDMIDSDNPFKEEMDQLDKKASRSRGNSPGGTIRHRIILTDELIQSNNPFIEEMEELDKKARPQKKTQLRQIQEYVRENPKLSKSNSKTFDSADTAAEMSSLGKSGGRGKPGRNQSFYKREEQPEADTVEPQGRVARTYQVSSSSILESFQYFTTATIPFNEPELLGFFCKRFLTLFTYLLISVTDQKFGLRTTLAYQKDMVQSLYINYCQNNETQEEFQKGFNLAQNFLNTNSTWILSCLPDKNEMEEEYLSLWEEEQGQCGVSFRETSVVSYENESLIDTEIQELIKSMNNIVFRSIKHASINHLVILLTHSNYYDADFLKMFFCTFPSFVSGEVLFKKLLFRYSIPALEDSLGKTIRNRVINAVKFWLKTKLPDFKEKGTTLNRQINQFLDQLQIERNPAYAPLDALLNKVPCRPVSLVLTSSYFVEPGSTPDLKISKLSPEDIAQSLTILEWDLWVDIKPNDLLSKTPTRAPEVTKLISHFNAVSQWVSSLIVKQERLSQRAKFLQKFIEVAVELERLNNFCGLFAVSSGINNSAVMRLKFTFEEISEKTNEAWKAIVEITSPTQNYAQHRTHVKLRALPLIPYLGQYLTDLTMTNDGNPSMVDGLINFRKRQLLYKVIEEVMRSQSVAYNGMKGNLNLVGVFQCLEPAENDVVFNEELYEQSKLREPRGVQTKKQLVW